MPVGAKRDLCTVSTSGPVNLDFTTLASGYGTGAFGPLDVAAQILEGCNARGDDGVWIHRLPDDAILQRAGALAALDAETRKGLPLFGIPFAIKDNIDAAGYATTAACPAFAYQAEADAFVVRRLLDAGAILIGKTNLDQFATGLVGIRTPYGVCANSFNADYVPGGSSSGSAVAVAAGLVSFALGTDTAGSGRIPAAFNNIIGLKPTRGLLSTGGVVPACRSLDCVSVFALTASDAHTVLTAAGGYDTADAFSRIAPDASRKQDRWSRRDRVRLAVPREEDLEFFGDDASADAFSEAVRVAADLGLELHRISLKPFVEAARLLYGGPWLAERLMVVRELLARDAGSLHPVTRSIIEAGAELSASDAFRDFYRVAELKRDAEALLGDSDALLLPTAPTIYRIDAVENDPVTLNSNLGYYTNFLNLFDMCGVAVPTRFRKDGLPFGVTFAGSAFKDEELLCLADAFHRAAGVPLGATGAPLPAKTDTPPGANGTPTDTGFLQIAVCGAHMRGLPLNGQLLELDAVFLRKAATTADYRLFALEHLVPPRPGLMRVDAGSGEPIELEIWSLPSERVGALLQQISAPLGLGTIALADGGTAPGFLCESHAVRAARDITEFRGWRAFIGSSASAPEPAGPLQQVK